MLSKLKSITTDNCQQENYGPMLEAMCKWGKLSDVLELITDWLESALQHGSASKDKVLKMPFIIIL